MTYAKIVFISTQYVIAYLNLCLNAVVNCEHVVSSMSYFAWCSIVNMSFTFLFKISAYCYSIHVKAEISNLNENSQWG